MARASVSVFSTRMSQNRFSCSITVAFWLDTIWVMVIYPTRQPMQRETPSTMAIRWNNSLLGLWSAGARSRYATATASSPPRNRAAHRAHRSKGWL